MRTEGRIGSSLQAEVEVSAQGALQADLASLGDDLRFVLITSVARLQTGEGSVNVRPSEHTKCDRCWHWRADTGADPAHPGLCGRCVSNLHGAGEPRACA